MWATGWRSKVMLLQKQDQDPQFLLWLRPEAMRSVRVHRNNFQWTAISNKNFSSKYNKDFWDPGANSQKKHELGSSKSASTHFSLESQPWKWDVLPPEAGTHHTAVCSQSNSGRQRAPTLQHQLIPQSNAKHFQPSQALQACTQIHFLCEINWANSYWYGQDKSLNLSLVSGRNTMHMHFNLKISASRALLEPVACKILVMAVAM